MESASPEPSRDGVPARTSGAATQDPAAADASQPGDLAAGGPRPRPDGHTVAVIDEQTDAIDHDRVARLARHVLATLAVPTELELSVTAADVDRITELNVSHMHATGPTDVLAFPIDAVADVVPGVPGLLGDVVLCPRVAHDQAADHGRSGPAELDLLLVHGILHLLGHDHARPDERARMFGLTDELLAAFPDGIEDQRTR